MILRMHCPRQTCNCPAAVDFNKGGQDNSIREYFEGNDSIRKFRVSAFFNTCMYTLLRCTQNLEINPTMNQSLSHLVPAYQLGGRLDLQIFNARFFEQCR